MATTNDFLVFGGDAAANVMTQAAYQALNARSSGFQAGTAVSGQLNKAWRQSSIIAALIGQFVADHSGQNAVDDGTTTTLEADFILALKAVLRNQTILADIGATNVYAAANNPPLAALPGNGYIQKVSIATTNTGASTYAPDGLAAKPIYGLGLQSLQGGELVAQSIATLCYVIAATVNSGNGAWVLVECTGGAQQVAPATQSQHALPLGQANATFAAINGSSAKTFDVAPATAAQHAIQLGQAAALGQQNTYSVASAGGTADALTGVFSPVITALTNGMTLYVRAGSANATTTPSFTPNGGTIAAKTIAKGNGVALVPGDIAGGGHWIELQYDATLDKWVLQNPAQGVYDTLFSGIFAMNGNSDFAELANATTLPMYAGTGLANFQSMFSVSYIDVVNGMTPSTRPAEAQALLEFMQPGLSSILNFSSGGLDGSSGFRILKLKRLAVGVPSSYVFYIPYQHVPARANHSLLLYAKTTGSNNGWGFGIGDTGGQWKHVVTRYPRASGRLINYFHIDFFCGNGAVGDELYLALPTVVNTLWPEGVHHSKLMCIADAVNRKNTLGASIGGW